MSRRDRHAESDTAERPHGGGRLRRYFLAGIVVTAPIAITLYVGWWFIAFVDDLVLRFVPPAYHPDQYLPFSIPGAGLIVVVIGITLIGAFAAGLVGRELVRLGEGIVARMPVLRSIYAALKQIFETVLTQYPDLEKKAQEVANWDRTQGYSKMQSMLQANPDISGVISGNDEMALGAIAALKEAGKLDGMIVGGFDGSPDAVDAVKAGELTYTVLQPVAIFAEEAVRQADHFINTGELKVAEEKQLFDCLLIDESNVDNYTGPFTLDQSS